MHDNGSFLLPYQMRKGFPMNMREAKGNTRGEGGGNMEETEKDGKLRLD